ncbi:MAG: phenazine biosynthesis protein PhzA/PhzB [Gordonia sp.]|nr:phenazine biosynthesis protein PhzA/PhzB [Gordonia sp. (in: high G+C Gram-positive bacteria)]
MTTHTDSQRREQARALHRGQLDHLLAKDMQAWVDAFAEDAVFELPFAPPNYPQRIEGKTAIYDYVKDYAKHIDLQGFPDVVEHQTLDPDVIVMEVQAEGRVIATNKPYRVRYVWVSTIKDGKIAKQRDYWNPLAVLDSLGGEEAMRETFNVEND